MSNALDVLLAKDAIRDVITRLFVHTDQRDWARVRACFAERVRFDMTSVAGGEPVVLTPEQIALGWEQGLQALTAVHHQMGNLLIDVGDGEATAFCYGIASHYLPNPTHANTRVFVGSYDFHLVLTAGAWRIDAFRFNLKYIEGNPQLEAAAGA